jgi:hypothetical protein
MKYLLTLSALALTFPAVGIAQATDQDAQDKAQPQATQPRTPEQMRPRPGQSERGAQQRQEQHERAAQHREEQMGRRTSQNRLTQLEASHIRIDDLKDTVIVNRQDQDLGSVTDVIVDQQGRVAAVIVTSGGLMGVGGKSTALSWDDLQVSMKGDDEDGYDLVVNLSEQEFESLPEFVSERRTAVSLR